MIPATREAGTRGEEFRITTMRTAVVRPAMPRNFLRRLQWSFPFFAPAYGQSKAQQPLQRDHRKSSPERREQQSLSVPASDTAQELWAREMQLGHTSALLADSTFSAKRDACTYLLQRSIRLELRRDIGCSQTKRGELLINQSEHAGFFLLETRLSFATPLLLQAPFARERRGSPIQRWLQLRFEAASHYDRSAPFAKIKRPFGKQITGLSDN